MVCLIIGELAQDHIELLRKGSEVTLCNMEPGVLIIVYMKIKIHGRGLRRVRWDQSGNRTLQLCACCEEVPCAAAQRASSGAWASADPQRSGEISAGRDALLISCARCEHRYRVLYSASRIFDSRHMIKILNLPQIVASSTR